MFAVDPAHALREIHRVLRPTGRVAVAVWGPRADNPWLGVLLDTITEVTGIVAPPPGFPGPFALSDEGGLRQLFAGAGFIDLAVDHVGAPLRSASFDAWWTRNLTVAGPVVAILNGLDDAARTELRDAVRAAVARYETDRPSRVAVPPQRQAHCAHGQDRAEADEVHGELVLLLLGLDPLREVLEHAYELPRARRAAVGAARDLGDGPERPLVDLEEVTRAPTEAAAEVAAGPEAAATAERRAAGVGAELLRGTDQ
jgi:hypothetical protein